MIEKTTHLKASDVITTVWDAMADKIDNCVTSYYVILRRKLCNIKLVHLL